MSPDPDWSTDTAPEALVRHAPEVAALLDPLVAVRPRFGEHELVDLVRVACAGALSLKPLPVSSAPTDLDRVEAAAVAFAEQFSVDVSALGGATSGELMTLLGDRTGPFVAAVYLADWLPRVRRVLGQLFAPGGWNDPPADERDPWPLVDELLRSVARLRAVDPVTTEFMRLREARQHNCRLCKSLRSKAALAQGVGEETFDELDHYEDSDLSARHKAALTLVDALVWQPGFIRDEVIVAVRQHFSPAEAVELVLDLLRNASSKIAVATGSDAAHVSVGVEIYDIAADGSLEFGLSAPTG